MAKPQEKEPLVPAKLGDVYLSLLTEILTRQQGLEKLVVEQGGRIKELEEMVSDIHSDTEELVAWKDSVGGYDPLSGEDQEYE